MPHQTNGILYDYTLDRRYSQELKRPVRRLIVFLPGQICHFWRMRKGNCCCNCSIPWSNVLALRGTVEGYNFEEIPVAFSAHREMLDTALSGSDEFESLVIFNGGSFFTDDEIPEQFRQYAIQRFADHPTARQLLVEARPEHLKEADLEHYAKIVGSKKLKVAIGLESSSDFVRNKLHGKAMGKASFERKVAMAKGVGVQIQVYVFLKPAGLTEKQAIEDVLETCTYLHEIGVDEMALSCAFIPQGSHLEVLYRKGDFRPPWLWSIMKIHEQAQRKGWPLSIGGFDDFPPPIAVAHNCDDCSEPVKRALDDLREIGRFSEPPARCECENEWLAEIS